MKILPTDIISGEIYLNLIREYKNYDCKQKQIIQTLQNRIQFLEWEVDDLRTALEDESEIDSDARLRRKIHEQRKNLISYAQILRRQKKEIENLTKENFRLQMELANLHTKSTLSAD